LIYFGNKTSSCGSVRHQGDNLTGAGSGDDEVVNVDLSRIPNDVERLVFVVNIYQAKSRNQDFGMIENAFIRILDDSKKEE
ncbi:TerD family protein, partial [Bifidobacterium longum]|nr:TerD family protein [Bifidobacterium longum]